MTKAPVWDPETNQEPPENGDGDDGPPPMSESERLRFEAELAGSDDPGATPVVPGGTGDDQRFLESVDLRELMSGDPPEIEWSVAPIIPARRQTSIVARRGIGKSLLLFEAACAKATGQSFLDQPGGPPEHVLYVDMEMGPDDLYDRMADLGYTLEHALFDVLVEHLHYKQLIDLPALNTEDGGKILEALIDRHQATVVVLDTAIRAVEGDENSAEPWTGLHHHTLRRLKRKGITFVVLDHMGKDEKKGSRGHSAKEDLWDLIWELTASAKTPDADLTLKNTKSRGTAARAEVRIERRIIGDRTLHQLPEADLEPKWIVALADDLDNADLSAVATLNETAKALRALGNPKSRQTVSEIARFRKARAAGQTVRNRPGTASPEPPREPPGQASQKSEKTQLALGEPDSEPLSEPSGTVKGSGVPPFRGNHPRPDLLPDPWPPRGEQ